MATIKDTYVLDVKTDQASRGIGSVKGAAIGLGASLGKIGPLAGAAVAALGGFAAITAVKGTIDDMDDLAKAARQAGSAANEMDFNRFQTFGRVLDEAGVGADRFSLALAQTQDRLAKGGGKIDGVIEKLGDSIRGMNGELLGGPELLEKMIVAFNSGQISAEEFQATVGAKVGPEIIRALGDIGSSAESLQAAMAEVEANSNIVSLDAANNAEAFNDTMGRLGEVAGQLGTDITSALLPVLVELAEGALALLPGVIDFVSEAFSNLSPIVEALQPVFSALWELLQALQPAFQLLFDILGPVAEVIGGALTAAIEGVTVVIETVIGVITRMVEGLQSVADKVGEISSAVGQKWNDMTDGITEGAENAYNGVTGWFSKMYDEVVGNSIIPDMADDVLKVMDFMNNGMESSVQDASTRTAKALDTSATSIADGFGVYADNALTGIEQMVDSISGGLYTKITNLTKGLSGSFGGIVDSVSGFFGLGGGSSILSSIAGGIADLFGGFFADGGRLPAGKFGVVGERGPELVSGPANITPLDGMFGGGGTQYVTYNINATDAQSFKNLVARDPGFIHAVAQRGAKMTPGGR